MAKMAQQESVDRDQVLRKVQTEGMDRRRQVPGGDQDGAPKTSRCTADGLTEGSGHPSGGHQLLQHFLTH
jgi:hypothetical protein